MYNVKYNVFGLLLVGFSNEFDSEIFLKMYVILLPDIYYINLLEKFSHFQINSKIIKCPVCLLFFFWTVSLKVTLPAARPLHCKNKIK